MPPSQVVQEGDVVILSLNGGEKQMLINAAQTGKFSMSRMECPSSMLVGLPWGCVLAPTADGRSLVRSVRERSTQWKEAGQAIAEAANNSRLLDDAANQALSAADIETMKAEGKSGQEIMGALTAGSSTFQGKTAFAQEKYLTKKGRKHHIRVEVQRPTACSLCQVAGMLHVIPRALSAVPAPFPVQLYFAKSPNKISYVRPDTLALMLSLANIGSHAQVLILETCTGLITGAAAERLGGNGLICSTHVEARPPSLQLTKSFNLTAQQAGCIASIPLAQLLQWRQEAQQTAVPAAAATSMHGADANATAAAGSGPSASLASRDAIADGGAAAPDQQAADGPCSTLPAAAAAATGSRPAALDSGKQAAAAAPGGLSAPQAVEQEQGAAGTAEAMLAPQASGQEHAKRDRAEPATADAQADAELPPKRQKTCSASQASTAGERHATSHALGPAAASSSVQAVRRACAAGFTCCLVAAPVLEPAAVMAKLRPLLAPSAQFAVFSTYQQLLADCLVGMQYSKQAVGLQLAESWWREAQVLPARTHPEMNMCGSGGYILSGTIVM